MKYLIGDIPYERLEEEKESKCQYISYLEIVVLIDEYNVGSTEKDDSATWENQLLYLVFVSSRYYEKTSCKDKESGCCDPEYRW